MFGDDEHLAGEGPVRPPQVERYEPMAERQLGLHRQRKEPRLLVDDAQAAGVHQVGQRTVGPHRAMRVVVEVAVRIEPEVRLDEDQFATRTEHPADVDEQSVDRVVVEVLEEVAGEHGGELAVGELAEVGRVADDRLDAVTGEVGQRRVGVDGDLAGRVDGSKEVRVAGGEIEHRSIGSDPPLQVGTDVRPHRGPCRVVRQPGRVVLVHGPLTLFVASGRST